jgi:transcriptional regulator of acetoin/glycerol metabolism
MAIIKANIRQKKDTIYIDCLKFNLDSIKKRTIVKAYKYAGGSSATREDVAYLLGISERTMYRYLHKYNLFSLCFADRRCDNNLK